MVRFDPRLHIDAETAAEIETTLLPLLESPTVLSSEAFPFALTAEILKDGVHVRAATGEEVTTALTFGVFSHPDDVKWPGDPAFPTGGELDWQEAHDSEVRRDRACHLWNGEVIFASGSGAYSPFFIDEQAARAWTVSTALSSQEEILDFQLVHYACARQFAPELIMNGVDEFKRLNRFWISPVRSWGRIVQYAFPSIER